MKITLAEIEPRLLVKLDKRNEVLNYDIDNAYPQRMERLVNSSVTAKSCARMYAKFIAGSGENLTQIIDSKGSSLLSLRKKVARDISYFRGFALQVNYNALFQVTEINHIPFQFVRKGAEDDSNYSGKIVVYDDWGKEKRKNILTNKFSEIDVFNPSPEIIAYQVNSVGGWDNYKGQILFVNVDDENTYPLAPIDSVIDDVDTDIQLAELRNNTVQNGFIDTTLIEHEEFEDEDDLTDFKAKIQKGKGAKNGSRTITLESKDLSKPGIRVNQITSNLNEKIYDTWQSTVQNQIRKAHNNIPVVLVDYEQGKLGNTSGESFSAAVDFYNYMTVEERECVEDNFNKLLNNSIFATKCINLEPFQIIKRNAESK